MDSASSYQGLQEETQAFSGHGGGREEVLSPLSSQVLPPALHTECA